MSVQHVTHGGPPCPDCTVKERLDKLEADNVALRAALAQALALVARSGFNWKDALRMVERWVRPGVKQGEPGQLPAAQRRA